MCDKFGLYCGYMCTLSSGIYIVIDLLYTRSNVSPQLPIGTKVPYGLEFVVVVELKLKYLVKV